MAVACSLVSATGLAQPAEASESPAAAELALAPEAAPGARPGSDEVLLKNGGMLRGDVVELIPDDHVTVIVAGQQREIPWAEVEQVNRGKFASPSPAEPEPAPAPASEQDPEPSRERRVLDTPSQGRPRVHLEVQGGKSVELQKITGGLYASGYGVSMSGIAWRTVCSSPCDRVIDAGEGQPFVLGNSPLTFSRKFKLNDQSGNVHIDVKPGNAALRLTGAFGLSFGISGVILGPVMIATDINDAWRRSGVIITAVGVPLLVGGIAMLVLGRTRFKLSS